MNELEPISKLFEGLSPGMTVLLYYVFNCLVQSMPDPDPGSTTVYVWAFKFLHTLAGNINVSRKKV